MNSNIKKHPFRLIIVLLSLFFSIIDWTERPTTSAYEILFGFIHIGLLLIALWFPRISFVGLIFMESVACSLPVLNGPSRFWGIYCTIGLTAYETGISITTVLGIFVFLGIQCYQIARWNNGEIDIISITVFLMYAAATVIVGYGFHWWKTTNEQHLQNYQSKEYELQHSFSLQNSDNAIMLHDSVAQCLTSIRLIAQRQSNDPQNDAWEKIDKIARKGLEATRDIIDTMIQDNNKNGIPIESSEWWLAVKRLTDECDYILHQHGFTGTTEIINGGFTVQQQVTVKNIDILHEVLRELCSNIIKHAPKYSEFQSSIALQKSQTEIVMSNSMSTIPDEERSGRGLESRRRKLNLIGGEIDHEVDGDTWIVYARIPLTMVSPDKAATESMEDNEHEKYSPRKRGKTRSVECQREQMARKEHKAQK